MTARARKRFGQHFLVDESVITQILESVAPDPGQLIFEIGPGRGALTGALAASGAELHLLEIDRDLARSLERRFAENAGVHVHSGDVLEMDLGELGAEGAIRLVGNLPYNISTPLIFHVLRWSHLVRDMHFMLQREVAERLAAPPGTRKRGRLSVMCQYRCEVQTLFSVPPQAFEPAPKVHSEYVRLVPHERMPVHADSGMLEQVVTRAFSMRRKTLRNSLRGMLDEGRIRAAGIDPGRRPETLGLEEFAALAALVK